MAIKTWDPGKFFVTVANIPITGIAKGTFISVERMSPSFVSTAGAGGEVAHARMRDKRATVKITLLQTAACNDALSALWALDEATGQGVGPFGMFDTNGRSVANAPNCRIMKPPTWEGAEEVSNREWELECDELDMLVGGNF